MVASTALNRAVNRSIERPAVNKAITSVLRVAVVPGDFDRLIQGYRLMPGPLLYCYMPRPLRRSIFVCTSIPRVEWGSQVRVGSGRLGSWCLA